MNIYTEWDDGDDGKIYIVDNEAGEVSIEVESNYVCFNDAEELMDFLDDFMEYAADRSPPVGDDEDIESECSFRHRIGFDWSNMWQTEQGDIFIEFQKRGTSKSPSLTIYEGGDFDGFTISQMNGTFTLTNDIEVFQFALAINRFFDYYQLKLPLLPTGQEAATRPDDA
jgi:hypothetical protein